MKNWYIIDDCTHSKSAVYDEIIKNCRSQADALHSTVSEWKSLAPSDRKSRDEFYIGYADTDEDGCVDYDTMTDILYIQRDGKPVYYIMRDLDGYGSATPVCEDAAGVDHILDDLYLAENPPMVSDLWREASKSDIAEYGIDE